MTQTGFSSYASLLTTARTIMIEGITMGKRPLRDTVYALTDLGVRFGIDDAARPTNDRVKTPRLAGKIDSFDDVVEANCEKAILALFTPSNDRSPLDVAVDNVLLTAIAFSHRTEELKDAKVESIYRRLLATAGPTGARRTVSKDIASEFVAALLELGEQPNSAEKVITYIRRALNKDNLVISVPEMNTLVRKYMSFIVS